VSGGLLLRRFFPHWAQVSGEGEGHGGGGGRSTWTLLQLHLGDKPLLLLLLLRAWHLLAPILLMPLPLLLLLAPLCVTGWDEILEGGLAEGATVMSWRVSVWGGGGGGG
jgi:hypothetical protein